ARDAPVSQPVIYLALSYAFFLGVFDYLLFSFFGREAREPTGVYHDARLFVCGRHVFGLEVRALGLYDGNDRDAVLGREFEVALVMRRDGHDDARAVGVE